MNEDDYRVAKCSVAYGCAAIFAAIVQVSGFAPTQLLVPLVAFLYAIHLVLIRRGLSDPLVVGVVSVVIYYALPVLAAPAGGLVFGIPLAPGYYVLTVATISMMFGVAISMFVTMQGSSRSVLPSQYNWYLVSSCAVIISVSLSVILTSLYWLRFGAVTGGDTLYGQSFVDRLSSGSGLLFYCIPLGLSGLAFAICRRNARDDARFVLIALIPYIMMYYVLGQRKFLLIPALLLAARYIKIRRLASVVVGVSALSLAILIFDYLGYMRVNGVDWTKALSSEAQDGFINNAEVYLAGETAVLMATASAAHMGVVAALPYGGDYFLAPLFSMPQFIFRLTFVDFNERFAFLWTRAAATRGGGWGFSYFGEADAVGGNGIGGAIVIFLAVLAMCLLFRIIYTRGLRNQGYNVFAVLGASCLPFALWFQRNAFAYFFKEFIFQQVLVISAVFMLSVIISNALARRQRGRDQRGARPNRVG